MHTQTVPPAIDSIWAAVKRECLEILAKGTSTPNEIDSAWLQLFGSQQDGPCKMMDREGLGVAARSEDDFIQERNLGTRAVDFLRNEAIEKGRVRTESSNGDLYPAEETGCAPLTLYFLDIAGEALRDITKAGRTGRVLSGGFDGRPMRVVVGNQIVPDGIAFSNKTRRIYWTNMGSPNGKDGHINSSKLDGSDVQTVLAPGIAHTPKQLVIDQAHHKLYFSDRGGLRVSRCELDGSSLEVLVQAARSEIAAEAEDPMNWCVGVAIDARRGHLYWTQKGPSKGSRGRIFRAGLDVPAGESPESRSDIEILFRDLPECIDLDLDPERQYLYWSDRGELPLGNSINRGYVGPDRAEFLARAHPLERKLGYSILALQLHEAIGIVLDKVNRHIYATDLGGAVYRYDLDGQGRRKVYEDMGAYTGICLVPSGNEAEKEE